MPTSPIPIPSKAAVEGGQAPYGVSMYFHSGGGGGGLAISGGISNVVVFAANSPPVDWALAFWSGTTFTIGITMWCGKTGAKNVSVFFSLSSLDVMIIKARTTGRAATTKKIVTITRTSSRCPNAMRVNQCLLLFPCKKNRLRER